MSMLPFPQGGFPRSFRDPAYELLARAAEERTGLPRGILDAIRTRGEMSNAGQVSEAGARTPYQFIPQTRQGMIKNYGVDPWKNPEEATQAAALLLRENFGRTKSWDKAITQYHGGLDSRNHGPRTRAYAQRVGSFDNKETDMPQRPFYNDLIEVADSYDPRMLPTSVSERPTEPIPVQNAPGMSVSEPAALVPPTKKKRGLLGSIGKVLENVFMPEPDSLYAAALRGGIWDAKANQQAYRSAVAKEDVDLQMANAKLKNLLTKGEYQIAGNNVIHFPADGGEPRVITPPATMGEKERLIDAWRKESDPEVKQLMERMLLGANSDEVLANREAVAETRAGATTSSARIRAAATGNKSGDGYEYKVVNGKLMRRKK